MMSWFRKHSLAVSVGIIVGVLNVLLVALRMSTALENGFVHTLSRVSIMPTLLLLGWAIDRPVDNTLWFQVLFAIVTLLFWPLVAVTLVSIVKVLRKHYAN